MAQHFGLRDLVEPVPVDYVRVDGLGYVECLRSNYGLWFFAQEHMAGSERPVNIVRAKLLLPSDQSLSDQLKWEWNGWAH